MDIKVYTSLNIQREDAIKALNELDETQYWANELDLTATAAHYLIKNKIDGIIALSAFGCGPDSLMVDEIEHHAKDTQAKQGLLQDLKPLQICFCAKNDKNSKTLNPKKTIYLKQKNKKSYFQ